METISIQKQRFLASGVPDSTIVSIRIAILSVTGHKTTGHGLVDVLVSYSTDTDYLPSKGSCLFLQRRRTATARHA